MMTSTPTNIIDRIAPRMPALNDIHDETLRSDLEEPTVEIPQGRGWSIGFALRPGWWVIVAAPLTVIIAVAVIAYCALTTRGPL